MSLLSAHIHLYQRNGLDILRDVSLSVEKGEHWVLLGPNGSGKSSLIKLITCYEWPTEGRVEIAGRAAGEIPVDELRKAVGIFEPALQAEIGHHYPWITAREIVMTGGSGRLMMFAGAPAGLEVKADRLLRGHGLDPDRPFSVMSAGEQRRTILLRCLLTSPTIMVLDEPYESLDIKARWEMEDTVERSMTTSTATLTAIHRPEEIPTRATHGLLIRGGRILAQGAIQDVMTSDLVSRLYDVGIRVWKDGPRYRYGRVE